MAHAIWALGVATVTAAGCVWYVPALADLRAGADRPVSRRTAAAACLSGWSTAGVIAVLLMLAEAWWIPAAAAGAGTAVTVALRVCAAVQHRRETHEAARQWSQLSQGQPLPGHDGSRRVVAVLVGTGLTTGAVTAILRVAAGPEDGSAWLAAVVLPAGVVAVFLTLAITYVRTTRRTPPRT
ncbi:hypothetical protein Stsp02_50710 [Streptomyces sp. NBRC 14336]|nr:hypothetical protein Stsp02_50710 [Streptomyces sp. NBRC 14336]